MVAVSKVFASSPLCSGCGYRLKDVKNLALREWTYPSCESRHDRDRNASIDLENEEIRLPGMAESITGDYADVLNNPPL